MGNRLKTLFLLFNTEHTLLAHMFILIVGLLGQPRRALMISSLFYE